MMDDHDISGAIHAEGLEIFGAFHPGPDDGARCGTMLLLGPREPGFWARFSASPEYQDGAPDPLDRWSQRVIGTLAEAFGAEPIFPFGGPPYQPFIRWALRSGSAWQSPAGPLVHDRAGMMVSYRGALALDERLELPAPRANPCETCTKRPCLSACPVGALSSDAGYDLAACHSHLDSAPGASCMSAGCAARRACPASQGYARLEAQSAFHMRAFHP